MTEKLHIRIERDGSIEVRTENIEPAEVAALVPVLEAMLEARAIASRVEAVPAMRAGVAAKQKRAKPVLRG